MTTPKKQIKTVDFDSLSYEEQQEILIKSQPNCCIWEDTDLSDDFIFDEE